MWLRAAGDQLTLESVSGAYRLSAAIHGSTCPKLDGELLRKVTRISESGAARAARDGRFALIRFKHPSTSREYRRTESRGGARNRKERKVHPDSRAAAARVEIADAVSTRSSPASTSVHPARLLLFITRGSPRPRPPRARAPRGTPARTAPCPSPVRWRWSRPSQVLRFTSLKIQKTTTTISRKRTMTNIATVSLATA